MIPVLIAVVFTAVFASHAKAQPAPALTDFQITQVRSEASATWESIPRNAFATSHTRHGGRWCEVKVRTTGYDDGRARGSFAGMTATVVSRTRVLDSWGRIVGFEYVMRWQTTSRNRRPFVAGQWVVTATSGGFPYRSFTARLYVQ